MLCGLPQVTVTIILYVTKTTLLSNKYPGIHIDNVTHVFKALIEFQIALFIDSVQFIGYKHANEEGNDFDIAYNFEIHAICCVHVTNNNNST